jgi:hypothetical protein
MFFTPWTQKQRQHRIVIYPWDAKSNGPSKKGHCYIREDLIASLVSTMVYQWTGPPNSVCCPDYNEPYYKLPVPPVFIDVTGLYALLSSPHKETVPNAYVLRPLKEVLLGNTFASSRWHGVREMVYTLVPLSQSAK